MKIIDKIKKHRHIITKNILKPVRITNLLGEKIINPKLNRHMLFQPSSIDIEPTTKCNLKCIFCHVPGWERSKIKNMSLNNFKNIIDKFPHLISIKIQGMGEPFLNNDIYDMVKYANSKNISVNISNNGTVLNKRNIEKLFKNPPAYLTFSLDTPNRDTFIKLRGKNHFDKLIDNIKTSVEERDKTKNQTKINLWCVLNEHNKNELEDLVRLAKKMNVDNLTIQTRLGSYGKDELKTKNDTIRVDINKNKTKETIDKVRILAKKLNLSLNIYKDNLFSEKHPCTWIHSSTYISVEGEIVPCCVLGDPQIASMGNIYKVKSFSEIWNNTKYKNLRKALKDNNLPRYCRNCYVK